MPIRAVTLDAAGTLIEPAEPVGATYARVAGRHGIALDAAAAESGFRAAFAAAPPLAFPGVPAGAVAERERAWWRAVVRGAFGAAAVHPAFEACFAELFAHYARGPGWRVYADAPAALEVLRTRGIRLGVVSNFDGRLPSLLAELGLARLVDAVLHSTAVGAAKPHPAIFQAAVARLGVPAGDTLHAGDGLTTDVEGARAAGLNAVLVDRQGRGASDRVTTVSTLTELTTLVE